jgi:hypothetical protein
MISGNMVGSYSQLGKTFILTDENGNELTGVVVDQETIFTAGDNDVREGFVYAGDSGVSTGTKKIPSYNTTEGRRAIPNGSKFVLQIPDFDYTKLQAIFCSFNTNLDDSVSSQQVVINNNVYDMNSTVPLASVQKDNEKMLIDFGITNTSARICLIRYFTYKEIY